VAESFSDHSARRARRKPGDLGIAETTPDGLLLRPAVTLPVEIYTEQRIREFDEAEAALGKVLRRKKKTRC
jgi:hypothetical protein